MCFMCFCLDRQTGHGFLDFYARFLLPLFRAILLAQAENHVSRREEVVLHHIFELPYLRKLS